MIEEVLLDQSQWKTRVVNFLLRSCIKNDIF